MIDVTGRRIAAFPSTVRGAKVTDMIRSAFILSMGLALWVAPATPGRAGEWIAAVDSGCRLWHPAPEQGQKVRWSGRCEKGVAQGDGVAEWFVHPGVAERCECRFVDGKAEGQGAFRWSDGMFYAGDFKAGVFEGRGYIRYPDNEVYEGEFRNGLPNGWGTQLLPDNTRIMGKFKDGEHVVAD